MSTAHAAYEPVKQTLAALRAGQESFARFVIDLFGDLESMQKRLRQAESELNQQRNALSEERRRFEEEHSRRLDDPPPPANGDLQSKISELEQERLALEEELESVRTRAVGMSQTISEQKRQMAEEHAEWAAELRQLRRILDKQASWIAQQAESGAAPWGAAAGGQQPAGYPAAPGGGGASQGPAFPAGPRSRLGNPNQCDPVLGSVLSQFEFLQKDLARRREQTAQARQ